MTAQSTWESTGYGKRSPTTVSSNLVYQYQVQINPGRCYTDADLKRELPGSSGTATGSFKAIATSQGYMGLDYEVQSRRRGLEMEESEGRTWRILDGKEKPSFSIGNDSKVPMVVEIAILEGAEPMLPQSVLEGAGRVD